MSDRAAPKRAAKRKGSAYGVGDKPKSKHSGLTDEDHGRLPAIDLALNGSALVEIAIALLALSSDLLAGTPSVSWSRCASYT